MTTGQQGPTAGQAQAPQGNPAPNEWPEVEARTWREASRAMRSHNVLWGGEPATAKQKGYLASRRLWRDGLRKREASTLIETMLEAERKMTEEEFASYRAGHERARRAAKAAAKGEGEASDTS